MKASLAALAIVVATSCDPVEAVTVITQVSQTAVASASGIYFESSGAGTTVTAQMEGGGSPPATASATQSATTGPAYQFSGTVFTDATQSTAAAAYTVQTVYFTVSGQSETLTLNLTSLLMQNYDGSNLAGFRYDLLNLGTNTYLAGAFLTTAQTVNINVNPGSYRFDAVVEVRQTFSDHSATYSDTVSLTNVIPEPSSVLLGAMGMAGLLHRRR